MKHKLILSLTDFPTPQLPFFCTTISTSAQRFALLAGGRAWTMLGSRENSKPEKCSKMPQNPTCPVHLVMMAGDHFPRENVWRPRLRRCKRHPFFRKRLIFSFSGCRFENALLGVFVVQHSPPEKRRHLVRSYCYVPKQRILSHAVWFVISISLDLLDFVVRANFPV